MLRLADNRMNQQDRYGMICTILLRILKLIDKTEKNSDNIEF